MFTFHQVFNNMIYVQEVSDLISQTLGYHEVVYALSISSIQIKYVCMYVVNDL